MQYQVVNIAQFFLIQVSNRPDDESDHLLPPGADLAFRARFIHMQVPFHPGAKIMYLRIMKYTTKKRLFLPKVGAF